MIKPASRSLLFRLTLLFLCIPSALLAAQTSIERPAFDKGKVTLTFADAPLKTMTETPFTIEVIGDTGASITDAKLHLSLDMPAMPMPPNRPAVTWSDGAYHGTAVFTMAGAWQASLFIKRPGYQQEEVIFEIEQVMMK